MAQEDIAAVGVRIETDGITRGIRSLAELAAQGPKVENSLKGIETAAAGVNKSTRMLGTSLAAFATGLSVKEALNDLRAISQELYGASAAAERLRIGLNFSSARGAAAEIAYLRDTSKALGLAFGSTAQAYQQFQAAARGTALEGMKARGVFESIAKASAVMGLSTTQTSGVLLALQQMVSKGTVQAEELRGQLGERLPGAFQIAARAMGVTTAELGKMLEQGQVLAEDFLPKFGKALNEHLGDAAEKAANRLDAATNRFDTAKERLMQNAGDSGVSQFWAGQINILTDGMDSVSKAMESARASGAGFTGQMLAGAGAALQFLNPVQALSYVAVEAGNKLQQAEKNLEELRQAGAKGSSNLMLREAYNHADRLVEKLRQAKKEQDALLGLIVGAGGGRGSYNPPTVGEMEARRAAVQTELDKYLSDNSRQTRAQIREEEIAKARKRNAELVAKAEGDTNAKLRLQAALKTEIANIEERYKDKSPRAGSNEAARLIASQSQFDIGDVKARMLDLTSLYSGAEAILEQSRRSGLIGEKEYYDAKLSFINLNIDAKKRELEQENAILEAQALKGSKDIDRDRKIAENKALINRLTQEGAMQTEAMTIQANSALTAQATALMTAEQAAQSYLQTLQRGFDRDVAGVGWGQSRRNTEAGRQQIEDKYAEQRQSLSNQRATEAFRAGGSLTADTEKFYQDQLAIIDRYEKQALDSYTNGVRQRLEAEHDWLLGVNRAWEDYASTAANVAQQTADIFGNAAKGMEDAVVNLAMTGKSSFGDLARSIISDIIRVQVRAQMSGIFGSLMGILGGRAAPLASSGVQIGGVDGMNGYAKGGVFNSPSLSQYRNQVHDSPKLFAFAKGGVFGEAGPEAIMPLKRGADGSLGVRSFGGGSGVVVNVHNYAGAQIEQRSAGRDSTGREIIEVIVKQAVATVADQLASDSGPVGSAMRGRGNRGMN